MLKLEEHSESTAPKELQELSDAFSKASNRKTNDLVVSASLTMIANVIESEPYENKLLILKGLTDFIITMGVRTGLKGMPTIDCDAKTNRVSEPEDPDDIETKVANAENDIADSECKDCDDCDGVRKQLRAQRIAGH